jgi:hypothetical protein
MRTMKFIMPLIGLMTLLSFTFYEPNLKIIRFTRLTGGFLVTEYENGVIKKQVKNRRMDIYTLTKSEKNEFTKELDQLNIQDLVSEIDNLPDFDGYPATMYLFIKDNDTIKTKFFTLSNLPIKLRKLDRTLAKNRKES